MTRDFASFTALAVFLYGMAMALVAMDDNHGSHSAIVAAHERN